MLIFVIIRIVSDRDGYFFICTAATRLIWPFNF